jgi:hypothetical protein
LRSISDAVTAPCLMEAAKRRISFQCDRMCFTLILPPIRLASVGNCLALPWI